MTGTAKQAPWTWPLPVVWLALFGAMLAVALWPTAAAHAQTATAPALAAPLGPAPAAAPDPGPGPTSGSGPTSGPGPTSGSGSDPGSGLPTLQLRVDGGGGGPQQVATSLQIVLLLTVLSLAPAILVLMTAFTRIVVVLSFVRNALATPNVPPNQVLIGLALFLTFFVMQPVAVRINQEALQPYLAGTVTGAEALESASGPLRDFMLRQTREKDLALFVQLAQLPQPEAPAAVPLYAVIPAYAISELKTAFQMGFLIFVPFLVIDMIVATTLMSMGMLMLPPVMVSLPFKILLFIMVDGWHLVVQQLMTGFAAGG